MNNQLRASAVPLSAIILAGGQSSRMGQDKALLSIQGVPLLQFVYSIAESCADKVYVVTPWPERYQELLPACQFIREMPPNHGPLVGFVQGFAQVQTDWVLLLACDLPRLRVEILQEWIAGLNSVGTFALLPRHAKGWGTFVWFLPPQLSACSDRLYQSRRSVVSAMAGATSRAASTPARR